MGHCKDTESDIKHTVICICGKSGSGKTYKANQIKKEYQIQNVNPVILDGDAIRKYVNYDLTYSDEDRRINNEIVANIAEMLYHQGHYVIISTVRSDIAFDILSSKNIKCKLIRL
jgi:adenylylsulfate kinase-like enzyme